MFRGSEIPCINKCGIKNSAWRINYAELQTPHGEKIVASSGNFIRQHVSGIRDPLY